jgi:phage terminase large subunit GpA-like protein
MPVKGVDAQHVPLGTAKAVDVTSGGKRKRRGIRVWPVGVSVLKSELYGWLRQPTPEDGEPYPRGYVHLPKVDSEFCKQLVAEQLVTKTVKGFPRREWQKLRERNEALDCRNYARAAAIAVGVDRFTEAQWAELERAVSAAPRPAPERREEETAAPAEPPRRRDGGWIQRRRGSWLR